MLDQNINESGKDIIFSSIIRCVNELYSVIISFQFFFCDKFSLIYKNKSIISLTLKHHLIHLKYQMVGATNSLKNSSVITIQSTIFSILRIGLLLL